MNIRANILSRKDQVNTKDDNKDIKMLKDELQTKRINTEAEIIMFEENQMVKETILLEEIQKNNMKEQEVQKELEKKNNQVQEDNRVILIQKEKSIF